MGFSDNAAPAPPTGIGGITPSPYAAPPLRVYVDGARAEDATAVPRYAGTGASVSASAAAALDAADAWSDERQRAFARTLPSSLLNSQRSLGAGAHAHAHAHAIPPIPVGGGASARDAGCLPKLWEMRAAPPFWRATLTIALSILLALAMDAFSSTLRLAWALSWPLALAAVVVEALYIVRALANEEGPPIVLGLSGLVRLFDVWVAWSVCCANLFMCFFVYDLHGRHFRGLEALSHDSTMLHAWSYFAPFSLLYCSGGGMVFLEPATWQTRLVVTVYAVLTFFFVVLVVYSGMSEVFSRRAPPRERRSAR